MRRNGCYFSVGDDLYWGLGRIGEEVRGIVQKLRFPPPLPQ